jgi:hypothetical protein
MKWTDEEKELLKALYPKLGSTISDADMEDIFGRSPNAIYHQAHAMKLSKELRFDNTRLIDFLSKKTGKKPRTKKEISEMVAAL